MKRVRLGGGKKIGSSKGGSTGGLKLRKVKAQRVKVVQQDGLTAPETGETIYTTRETGGTTVAPGSADRGSIKRTTTALKSLRPGTGWR